jgi:hypothetical protein
METRPLTDNRFMLEFGSEQLFKFVTNGGPRRHKGSSSCRMTASGVHQRDCRGQDWIIGVIS